MVKMSVKKFRLRAIENYRSFISTFQGSTLSCAPNIQNSSFSGSEGNWSDHENISFNLVHPLYQEQLPLQF